MHLYLVLPVSRLNKRNWFTWNQQRLNNIFAKQTQNLRNKSHLINNSTTDSHTKDAEDSKLHHVTVPVSINRLSPSFRPWPIWAYGVDHEPRGELSEKHVFTYFTSRDLILQERDRCMGCWLQHKSNKMAENG